MNNKLLLDTAEKMAAEIDSLYLNSRFRKNELLEFMEVNEWFGLKTLEITTENIKTIKEPLTLWLSAYKQPGRIKIELMLRHFEGKFPQTCRLYRKFVEDNRLEDEPSAWKLLDFILAEIDRDITEYNEANIETLIKRVDAGATRASARIFSDFLKMRENGKYLTKWIYDFDSLGRPEGANDAYPIEAFSVMAYCVFNEEAWEKHQLIEKAVKSRQCADLWLFTALRFICALRATDLARLPAPALPYDGDTVLSKILINTFEEREATALVEELCIRLKLNPLKPSKTSAHKNVPIIKLYVPESLRVPLGIIIAIALAHRPETHPGERFVFWTDTRHIIRSFFGEQFAKALGGKYISTRRYNKSYLQGIDAVGGDSPGKPKGYMLAALARSHKSGICNLDDITEIYLKDAKFRGYTPEFIIREMFERGVFSFIPALLLETYAGSGYKALTVSSQTKLICELGFAAHQIEWMVSAAERALIKSRTAVNSILQNPHNINKNIGEILQNIASGNAPGRQDECLCLMTAAGFPCPHPNRDTCIGCGYEIYTKTATHTLMSEYTRLTKLRKMGDKSDAWRYEKILEQAVLPAISEMLSAVKLYYKDANITEILNIVERGIELC